MVRLKDTEDHDRDPEREHGGNHAVLVPVLSVTGYFGFSGFYVPVRREGSVRIPAEREAGGEKQERQNVCGRSHRDAFPPKRTPC
jgi:hypothetical protein